MYTVIGQANKYACIYAHVHNILCTLLLAKSTFGCYGAIM